MLIIKSQRKRALGLDEPLKHESHKKPVTRRDFLAQGFITGGATVVGSSMLAAMLKPGVAEALSPDIAQMATQLCKITAGAGKIPYIHFDLAGGANIAGSNVLIGGTNGQTEFLTTQGYARHGIIGTETPTANAQMVNTELGLAFHARSAMLAGIKLSASATTLANVNGCVIPARSENDTGTNPHITGYGIARAGAKGLLLTQIGSQNSDSGGNSMSPAMWVNPADRPAKVDRPSDTTGLVDTGELATLFTNPADTVAVMESMVRLTNAKMQHVNTGLGAADVETEDRFRCGYVKTADTTEKFGSPGLLAVGQDLNIVGPTGIFGQALPTDNELLKTASVMKLVVPGFAGAGVIAMGGFDYHTGERATGEARDLRAGRCIGAVLEYAARNNVPVMIYVSSDGSLTANQMIDNSAGGGGKFAWAGDNQGVAASFFLVYNPAGRPTLLAEDGIPAGRRQQIGAMTGNGDVNTGSSPVANNVTGLAHLAVLNYMALHGEAANFPTLFPTHSFGDTRSQRALIAFNPIVNGRIGA